MSRRQLLQSVVFFSAEQLLEASECGPEFRGFDSRLAVEPRHIIAGRREPIIAFEVERGRVHVVTPRRYVVFAGDTGATMPLLNKPDFGVLESGGTMLLCGINGCKRIGPNGLSTVDSVGRPGSRLFASNIGSVLNAEDDAGYTRFLVAKGTEPGQPLARLAGVLRTASWSPQGLAAICGDSLWAWPLGEASFTLLLRDPFLANSQDLCLVPGGALVALPNSLVLITQETLLVVAGMSGRVRFLDGKLWACDRLSGTIFEMDWVESLLSAKSNQEHALNLLQRAKVNGAQSASYLEAVRLMGCAAVQRSLF